MEVSSGAGDGRNPSCGCKQSLRNTHIQNMKIKHLLLMGAAVASSAHAAVITFESLPLGDPSNDGSTAYTGPDGGHYWNGSNDSGSFAVAGATFNNEFTDWGGGFASWAGFAYSNTTDTTTAGFSNQYSSITGGGLGGSATYVVGYYSEFGPVFPTITFGSPLDLAGRGAIVTNTTYTALDMLNGSGFSAPFGGASGDVPDFLRLRAEGFLGGSPTGSAGFLLADYRFTDNALDYIVDTWQFFSLSSLGVVDEVRFSIESSNPGTPTYFALGAFNLIPEPGSAALTAAALSLLALRRRRAA